MNKIFTQTIEKRKKNLSVRLKNINEDTTEPMFGSSSINLEISDRISAVHCGGIGIIRELVNRFGIPDMINKNVKVFKRHKPYFESDHILNMAYNIACGGTCIEDIELLRNNETYMDAMSAKRIPDPTTAGDFLRRFKMQDILDLSSMIENVNIRVAQHALNSKEKAVGIIDVDGKIQATTGECKEKMDITYTKEWGFSVLLLTEATTGMHLNVVNRPGNALSQEGAAEWMNRSIDTVKKIFRRVIMRGDSAFSLTKEFDAWSDNSVDFIFGYDNHPNLVNIAESLEKHRWKKLQHDEKNIPTTRRRRKKRTKKAAVVRRGYWTLTQTKEYVSEFMYRPGKCNRDYRVIVIKKHMDVTMGQQYLFDEYRYFFYITNMKEESPKELVRLIRGRCNHENKIEQMANGVHALKMPAAEFDANWAYMLIGAFAWNLKIYAALMIPDKKISSEFMKCEYKHFQNAFINIPCQILHTGRKLVYRFLNYSPMVEVMFKMIGRLRSLQFA